MPKRILLFLLAGLLISTSQSAISPDIKVNDPVFVRHWNDFAVPMTMYLNGLSASKVKADQLKDAIHAWRRLEKEEGWDAIR